MSDKKEIDKERNRTKKNGVVLLELPFSFTCVLNAISLRKQYGIGIINESILYIYVKINIKSLNFSFWIMGDINTTMDWKLGDYIMFKEVIKLPLIFLIVSTFWQLIFQKEVQWGDNIGISFMMFLIILIYNLLKKNNERNTDRAQ